MTVKVQENIYEMICYSGLLHGVEIWRVKLGEWVIIDGFF